MKALIALLALTLLIVPMLAGISRMRRLPAEPTVPEREEDAIASPDGDKHEG